MKRRFTPILLATAAALALAGCGAAEGDRLIATQSGTDATTTAPTPKSNNRTRAGAKAALLAQFAAYQSGDAAAAYATLSKGCQEWLGDLDDFAPLFDLEMSTLEDIAGSKLSELELVDVEVLEFTRERAGLTSSLNVDGAPVYDEEEEGVAEWLVYEDGEWKAECPNDFEVEEHFEPVGEVIEDGTETSTTVTTVPPNWPAPSTTMPGKTAR